MPPVPNIRALGFDLGDTLLHYRDTPMSWVSLYRAALTQVAACCGAAPTPEQFAQAEAILTRYNTRVTPRSHEVAAEEIWSHILPLWGLDRAAHPAATEAFFNFFQQRMDAYPETVAVLTRLRARGFPIGILTDVAYGMPRHLVQRDVDGAGLPGLYDVLVTSVEVGRRKPEPAGYIHLAARLGVAPTEMIYLGNEPKDVIGARQAGAIAILLDRPGHGENHGQHFTVRTLEGLEEILAQQGNPLRRE